MRQFIFVVLLASVCTGLYGQTGKISGRVIDAKTLEPLPFANVYVNNTTIGVITNATGEFVLPNLPVGSTDIVFSFIGYIPQQLKLVVKETNNVPLAIQLSPDAQQVSEVQVKAGRDKTWEKQLRRFEKVFLGNTSHCKIRNPWVIDFTDQTGGMTAKASIPVEIDNSALGYKLFFQLKNFSYSPTTFSIVGNIRFTEMETSDESVARNWAKNRERAYRGSIKHLMKSILDNQISKQGFLLYRDKLKGQVRGRSFSAELDNNILPYDTASLAAAGLGLNEYRIAIKDRMEVHYIHDFTLSSFYKDLNRPVSWLEVRGGSILVNKEGTLLNPTDVAISGNMSDARVSGMLPLDYKPGITIIRQSAPANFSARRLQEKVYLHTDRPYYYPGDNLWFSAYMNYRNPGLVDTLSRVLYVDLISADRGISQNRILPIDSGRAASSFTLPSNMQPGKYVLRAYTQWMRNYGIAQFFYKPIDVLSLNERVDGVSPAPTPDSLLHITFDKPEYKRRSRVNMTLSLNATGLDDVVKGSFSVAILDETLTIPPDKSTSIETDFDLAEVASEALTKVNYPIEKGISLEGIYKDKKGKAKKTMITLLPENLGNIYQVLTGSNGEFSLSNLAFYDSTRFVVKPESGKMMLVPKELPPLPDQLPDAKLRLVPLQTPHTVFSMDTLQARMLAEVKVAARKTVQSENSYAQADFIIKGENISFYASVADAIASKLPSFKLIFDQMNWFLIWARSSMPTSSSTSLFSHEPNLYINDVLVVGETAGDRLMQLNPSMIDHIEVNGMISSNQGANGSNGLINVYTKRVNEYNSKGLTFIKVRGFDRPIPFRSPNYDRPTIASTTGDYRTTLYWNPRLTLTSAHTPVELSFFTSDQPGSYRVIIEGVTNQGTPIRSEALLHVNE